MSAPVSAMMMSARVVLIPGTGHEQLAGPTKGLDHHLDPMGELVDRGGVLVDQTQVQPGQERVVLGEPAFQRLGQRGDLVAEPGPGPGRPAQQGSAHRRSSRRASPGRRGR